MNSNLDNNFKDAFEQYELPYNPAAWNALNDKLDKIQQTSENAPKSPSSGSGMKWIAGSTVAVIVASALIFMLTTDDSADQNKVATAVPSVEQGTGNNTSTADQSKTQGGGIGLSTKNDSEQLTAESNYTKDNQQSEQRLSSGDKLSKTDTKLPATAPKNVATEYAQPNTTGKNPSSDAYKNDVSGGLINNPSGGNQKTELIFPDIDYTICEHSSASITNKNSNSDLIVTSPDGKEQVIPAGKTITYQTGDAGTYTITAKKSSTGTSFSVKESPTVDFVINDEIKYENGIPSIPLESYSDATGFEWSFEGSSMKQHGTKAYAHFYKKGIHEITLTGKNSSGCKNSVTKSVTVDEDYNLLAPSAFMPQSDDNRKNKFIPIALTMRNTDFRLMIIEPRTGAIIYETTSKEGWDGIDRNTNRLVEENKSYAWKVILATPEPGERKEYSGIVVRL